MKEMGQKRKKIKFRYLALLFAIMVAAVFGYLGDHSEAAEGLFITCDGYELSPTTPYQMKNKSVTLILGSQDSPIYADSNLYEVVWSIESGNDIAKIEKSTTSQIYGNVTATAPGEVTVLVTVFNKIGDEIGTTVGSVTCRIQVVFGIDTSTNDNVFKYPYDDSTDKAMFFHTNSTQN